MSNTGYVVVATKHKRSCGNNAQIAEVTDEWPRKSLTENPIM
jgi:hypothetical protein